MLKQNLQVFIKEAEKFYKADYWRDDEEILVNKYFEGKGKRLLVLGCGAGRTLKPLYDKGFDVTAIDIVPEMVKFAKNKVGGLPIGIYQMDATDLNFENNSFDYVFFPFHGLSYVYPDIYRCVKEVSRILKKDGVAIFNLHNRLYLKRLYNFFGGKYYNDKGLLTYRSLPFDYFKLKEYFKEVKMKYRISLSYWEKSNWKDICYRLLPIFDKSVYWICQKPKK